MICEGLKEDGKTASGAACAGVARTFALPGAAGEHNGCAAAAAAAAPPAHACPLAPAFRTLVVRDFALHYRLLSSTFILRLSKRCYRLTFHTYPSSCRAFVPGWIFLLLYVMSLPCRDAPALITRRRILRNTLGEAYLRLPPAHLYCYHCRWTGRRRGVLAWAAGARPLAEVAVWRLNKLPVRGQTRWWRTLKRSPRQHGTLPGKWATLRTINAEKEGRAGATLGGAAICGYLLYYSDARRASHLCLTATLPPQLAAGFFYSAVLILLSWARGRGRCRRAGGRRTAATRRCGRGRTALLRTAGFGAKTQRLPTTCYPLAPRCGQDCAWAFCWRPAGLCHLLCGSGSLPPAFSPPSLLRGGRCRAGGLPGRRAAARCCLKNTEK